MLFQMKKVLKSRFMNQFTSEAAYFCNMLWEGRGGAGGKGWSVCVGGSALSFIFSFILFYFCIYLPLLPQLSIFSLSLGDDTK